MGNCCSEAEGGRSAVAVSQTNPGNGSIDAVELYLRSRGFQGLYSQIELSLAASDLRDRDDISKSDPVAVIYTKGRDGKLAELGRTEIVPNSINPIWITKHNITYHFEVVQSLVFHVYDVDTQFQNVDVKMLKLDEQQFLGEATCALSEIMTKSDRSLTLDLVHREESMLPIHVGKRGTIKVHAEESGSSKITAEMVFRCLELENKDLFSKSDPFLVISKVVESGMTIPVSKTEVIKNELKPIWKSVSLNIQQIGSKGGGMHAIVTLSAIQNLEQPKFDVKTYHFFRYPITYILF